MESQKNGTALPQVAEIELVYKTQIEASKRPKVVSSRDAFKILLQNWDKNKIEFVEQFKILLLNRGNGVLAIYEISTGGVSSTVIDSKLIFTAALKMNASVIILAHNHPSGSLKPSQPDIQMTQKVVKAARLLDMKIVDHLIITPDGYYSFADEGAL